jgi:hypothetical protein
MRKSFFIVLSLSIFYGCPNYDPSQEMITVHNYTDSAIYVCHSCSDTLPKEPALNLFELIDSNSLNIKGESMKGHIYSPDYRVNAYSYGSIGIPANESAIKQCCDKKIRLYFITEKTMREKTWKEIHKNQLYKKKITLTIDELKECDWEIEYP